MKKAIFFACLILLFGCKPSNEPDETNVTLSMHKSAKRGAAFKFSDMEDVMLLSPYIYWDYN